jgi:hypothetical protein
LLPGRQHPDCNGGRQDPSAIHFHFRELSDLLIQRGNTYPRLHPRRGVLIGAGFQAFTDSGVFQIDGESVNFGFRQHSVCTTSDGGAGYNTLYPVSTQLTFGAQSPIVAIYSPGDAVALLACKENGNGTWTATFGSPTATTFDVYIFDEMSACPPSGSRFGFQAFNSQGTLIADSAIPFLKVMGAAAGDLNVPPPSTAMQGGGTYTQQWSYGIARVATVVGVTATAYAGQGLTAPGQG